eukprot:370805_1
MTSQWEDWKRATSRENKHIQSWLKLNRSINDSNDITLQQCLLEIADVFKGHHNFFYFISNFASKQEIDEVHDLLQTVKIKHESSNKEEQDNGSSSMDISNDLNEDDDYEPHSDTNLFNLLPTESISHICSFLDRSSIKDFKGMSRRLGVICLEEQTKIRVSVFNANDLINNHTMNLYDFGPDKFSNSRNNANKRVYSFIEEWSDNYNVPENDQLIAQFSTRSRYNSMYPKSICDLRDKRLQTMHSIEHRGFLILDKRQMVVLNKSDRRLFNIGRDSIHSLKDYKLVMLEYYDVLEQQCNVVQFMLCHKDVTYVSLLDYIEHKFVYVDGMDREWHDALSLILRQMNYNTHCHKLCIYESLVLIDSSRINERLGENCTCCFTVQLNPMHNWFRTTNKLEPIKKNCVERLDAFHLDAKVFCKNIINARIKYMGSKELLMNAVQKYYMQHFDEQEREVFDDDLKNTLTFIQGLNNTRSIRTSKSSLSGSARIKLAQLFQNIIPSNNIELFDYDYGERIDWNHELGGELRFGIVLYDTKQFQFNVAIDKLYHIRVHGSNEGAYPFNLGAEDSTTLTIKHKKQFKVKSFMDDMFASLEKAKGHLLHIQHRKLLDMYFKNRKRFERNTNIRGILTERQQKYNYYNKYEKQKDIPTYDMNDVFDAGSATNTWERNKIRELDLFLIQTENDDDESKFKLKIKFVSSKFNAKTDVNTLHSIRWVGMPMVVWIEKHETLQQVLNQYLDDTTKEMIQCTYRVIVGNKVVSIAKSKRSKYKPYYEYLKDNEEDYIVLSLTKSKTQGKHLPIYSAYVHQALHGYPIE